MTLVSPIAARTAAVSPVASARAASSDVSTSTALGAFTDLTADHGFEPMRVEGALPTDLRGTLYRNGPARFSSFGSTYGHWFDGDGALSAARFSGGRAEGAARILNTRGLVEERRRGRSLYAGFGTRSPRGILTRLITSERKGLARLVDSKNVANTSVMWDGERLLALWEGGRPTEVDPADLSTLGETDLDGAVAETFSAHPHYAPGRKTTYNFGTRYGRKSELDVYAKRDGGRWARAGVIELPGPTMIHDLAVTETHLIVIITPLRVRTLRMLLGLGTIADNMAWRGELGTIMLVAPLDDLSKVTRLEGDARFFWHVANAYDSPGGATVDLVLYDDFASNDFFGALPSKKLRGEVFGRLSRAHLDFAAGTVKFEEICGVPAEFPIVAPADVARPHRYVYMAGYASREASGRDLHDRLLEADVTTGKARTLVLGDKHYPGEPIFVPRANGGERDGWILTLVYDAKAHTSHVAVIDAARFEDGPVARAHFGHHVPLGFHGTWAPAT